MNELHWRYNGQLTRSQIVGYFTNTVSLPTRQMCDAWPRIPGVIFRRKMGTFFVVFQRGVRQRDIHVYPSPSDIDERKSMFINGDAVAIVYWFVLQIHH